MKMKPAITFSALIVSALALSTAAYADDLHDLANLSLEDLLQQPITSAAKHSEPLDRTAAAAFIVTKEDIRRSGATSLPEILRMVPGLDVARVASGEWAISSRGFNGVFADRLLVMIDGRTIYTSIFSGTFWDEHDIVLEDINRIEIVRGPGATLWGANAVDGIINIITENAKETTGTMASVVAGSEDHLISTARQGGTVGDTSYRVYAKYSDRDNSRLANDEPAYDAWESARGGFRSDTTLDADNDLTLEGEGLYTQKNWDLRRVSLTAPDFSESVDETRYAGGGHARARWTDRISPTSELSLQSYYEHVTRDDTVLLNRRDTFDIDFQHRFQPAEGHEFIYGADYRHYDDAFGNTFFASLTPDNRAYDLTTAFAQDQISLSSDVQLIAGTKIEQNYSSGFEIEPNVRLIWNFVPRQAVWAAVSRAVRSPARFNEDGKLSIVGFPGEAGLPAVLTLRGDRTYDSNTVIAYEAGYRYSLADTVSVDVTGFYNDLDSVDTSRPAGDPALVAEPVPYIEVPLRIANDASGESYGAELALNARPLPGWRLALAYSALGIHLTVPSTDLIYANEEDLSPKNQVHLRSMIDLPNNCELDAMYRFVDTIGAFDIPSYHELDLRLGWKISEQWELSVVGQNLIHPRHPEFASNFVDAERTDIQRAVYAKVTFQH